MALRDYFDVYFPSASVDAGHPYFFFNSLAGTELGGAVSGVLNSQMNQIDFKTKDSEGFQIINNAMQFLKSMVEAEQVNERSYFTENIINNKKLPQKMRAECKDAISGTTIDYKSYIKIMNEYYDGAETYKKNLQFEIRRLSELEKLYKKFNQYYKQDPNGMYTISYIDKNTQKDVTKQVNYYTAFSDFLKKGFKEKWLTKDEQQFGFNTKTISNLIQDNLKSIFNQIWKNINFREKIMPYVMNGFQDCAKQLTTELLTLFLKQATPVIINMLNNQNNDLCYKLKGTDIKKIVSQFLDSIDKVPGASADEKIENSTLSDLLNGYSGLMSEHEYLNYNNNRIIRAYDEHLSVSTNKKGGIDNLGPEMIDLLQSLLQSRTKGKLATKAAWDRSDIYNALTQAFPNDELHIKNGKYDWDKMTALINSELEGKELITVNIAAKDNIVSESFNRAGLAQAVLNDKHIGETILTFGIQKADVSGIEIATVEIKQGDIDWNQIASKLTKGFIQTLDLSDTEIETPNLSFNEKEFRSKNSFGKTEFSIEAETMRRLAMKEKDILELKKELEDKKLGVEEIETILNSLKNNIQIGSTVKSYNKYDSSKGFHGGSLGGTVENQIKNIYQLFQYGGVNTLPKQDWLIFAIYNSGAGLMGSALKGPIEDLLSTVAVMLMFDDVGQQAVYLNQQMVEKYNLDSHNGSRFLHLYNLNGTYYPASFVLQLTYNKLTEIFSILQLDKMSGTEAFDNVSNGSRAEIINPVSEMLEIGTKTGRKGHEIVTTEQNQWTQTFKVNRKSVSVNITFLAGMLDIIKILNSSL